MRNFVIVTMLLITVLFSCRSSPDSTGPTTTKSSPGPTKTSTKAATKTKVPNTSTPTTTSTPSMTSSPSPTEDGPLFVGDPVFISQMETFNLTTDNGAVVSVDIPGGMEKHYEATGDGEEFYGFTSSEFVVVIYLNDFSKTSIDEITTEEFVGIVIGDELFDEYDLIDQHPLINERGVQLEFLAMKGGYQGAIVTATIVYIHEQDFGVSITYFVPDFLYLSYMDKLIQSIDSFDVDD